MLNFQIIWCRTNVNHVGSKLLIKVLIHNGFIERPKMIFLMLSLKFQLIIMYQHLGFKESFWKWTNRDSKTGLYSDIYDEEVWKTFLFSLDYSNSRFFTPETANSNLNIMINLDWFQPFEFSVYSTEVIYV